MAAKSLAQRVEFLTRQERTSPQNSTSASSRSTPDCVPSTAAFAALCGAAPRSGILGQEILRLLKRAIAREMFRLLTRACPIDDDTDLRPGPQAKILTLAVVANHFGIPVITVSRLERGHQRNDELATYYRQWLTAA